MPRKRIRITRTAEGLNAELAKKLPQFALEPPSAPAQLRERVQQLVDVHRDLREIALHQCQRVLPLNSASERILAYFRMFVGEELEGEEIDVVSGISEYPRRIREWRVEFGWPIETRGSRYVLLRDEPDAAKAQLWQSVNAIRRNGKSARDRMLDLFLTYPKEVITTAQLRYVTEGKDMRRVRELRTQFGYRIMTRNTGQPDLKPGQYVLVDPEPVEEHDRHVDEKIIAKVLTRDENRCRKAGCGWHPNDRVQGDPRQYIELHHITWHSEGGANEPENLVTVCNMHHREIHRQKIRSDQLEAWLGAAD